MDFLESDEMSRVLFYRYFSSAASKGVENISKVAKEIKPIKAPKADNANVIKEPKKAALPKHHHQQQPEEPELPLEEAIKLKRDLKNLKDSYEPANVEKYWYKWWLHNKYFHADAEKAVNAPHDKKFIMVVPPPNVTGYLHIGHALTTAIEDCLTRWHRMKGDVTCWLPGVDHAGIATQSVVEKQIWKENKITKRDLGRAGFLDRVWEWKQKHGQGINDQFYKLGASLDWERYVFTMDPKMNKAVNQAFVTLFERKLIYRANRLVNWSCKLKTALSDIEVEYEDINEPTLLEVPGHTGKYEFGVLIKFAYKVKGSNEEIIVATTRIETMLGDTAVAVNSKDARYTHLIGKELEHPFIKDRVLKVIVDDELVDMSFGTGCVKITPGHDFRDYECGKRNKLESINIFTDDGAINKNGGPYEGKLRFDCRNEIIKDLDALKLLRGKEKNPMRLGFCSRSGDVIEPLLRPQWYVSCKEISYSMIEVVKKKELNIIPEAFETTWFQWLENIQDWCISRQIWWGHRCPVYLVTVQGGTKPDADTEKDWVAAQTIEEAYEKASVKYGVSKDNLSLEQDEDVLDTWFSSALFPFSPFNWPNEEDKEFKAFYPGHLLETGHDILFFWVARMVMMGLLLTKKLPFNNVYLHQIVRDEDGEKMSKSKGNVIDPLDIIEGAPLEKLIERLKNSTLPQSEIDKNVEKREKKFPEGIAPCGTDSLRFGLLSYTIQSRYINLDVQKIVGYRLFCNKIWNTFKFAMSKFPENFVYDRSHLTIASLNLLDKWILYKLNYATAQINKTIHEYKFGETTQIFHNFWLYELCDIYLEGIKPAFYKVDANPIKTQTVLFTSIEQGLRLLHPIMPFITEELYQKLPLFAGKSESICIAPYPQELAEWNANFKEIDSNFEYVMNIVKTIRSMCSGANLPPSAKPQVFLVFIDQSPDAQAFIKLVQSEQELIVTLSKSKKIDLLASKSEVPNGCIQDISNNMVEVYLYLKELIKPEDEIKRLTKKIESNNALIDGLKKKMTIKDYDTKVPENVKQTNKEKMEAYLLDNQKLTEALNETKKLL